MKPSFLFHLLIILLLAGCAAPAATPLPPAVSATALPPTATATPRPTRAPTRTPTVTLTPTAAPTLPPGVVNEVRADFLYTIAYASPSFTFKSREVTGVSHIATHVQNLPDSSGAPLYGLALDFKAETRLGSNLSDRNLVVQADPNYRWSFGDVPEEPYQDVYSSEAYVETAEGGSAPFTPPLDITIEVSQTQFKTAGPQTVRITILPHGAVTFPSITVHLSTPYLKAQGKVTDYAPGEVRGKNGEVISVSREATDLFVSPLPLVDGQPYTFTFTAQVEPGQSGTDYAPYISIAYGLPDSGTTLRQTVKANSLAFQMPGVGTWTWSTGGEVQWDSYGSQTVSFYNINFGLEALTR